MLVSVIQLFFQSEKDTTCTSIHYYTPLACAKLLKTGAVLTYEILCFTRGQKVACCAVWSKKFLYVHGRQNYSIFAKVSLKIRARVISQGLINFCFTSIHVERFNLTLSNFCTWLFYNKIVS